MYWQELRLWRPMTFPSAQPNGRLRLGMAPPMLMDPRPLQCPAQPPEVLFSALLLPLQPFGLATLLKLTYPRKPFLTASMPSSHVLMLQLYESWLPPSYGHLLALFQASQEKYESPICHLSHIPSNITNTFAKWIPFSHLPLTSQPPQHPPVSHAHGQVALLVTSSTTPACALTRRMHSRQILEPNFSRIKGYNGAAGSFEAQVNMGPVEPPQRKGRLPQYGAARKMRSTWGIGCIQTPWGYWHFHWVSESILLGEETKWWIPPGNSIGWGRAI